MGYDAVTNQTNIRIWSPVLKESFGEWYFSTDDVFIDSPRSSFVLRDLKEIQKLEPENKWRLETRGTKVGWHEWKF
jgi:hypothetical protein